MAKSLKGVGRCPVYYRWAKSKIKVLAGIPYIMDGPRVKMVMANNHSSTWANVIDWGWPMIMCGSAYPLYMPNWDYLLVDPFGMINISSMIIL